jgi:hypothetical protein
MTGHVFHPGHAELHGVTVVVETTGSRTYVGRYDSQDQFGLHMLDVGIHDATTAQVPRDEYIGKSAQFGIRTVLKHVVIPGDEILRITRLGDLA